METTQSSEDIKKLLARAKKLAQRYRALDEANTPRQAKR
jgi:hypothetical protein